MQIQFPAFRICISSCSSSPSCPKNLPWPFNALHLSEKWAIIIFKTLFYKLRFWRFFSAAMSSSVLNKLACLFCAATNFLRTDKEKRKIRFKSGRERFGERAWLINHFTLTMLHSQSAESARLFVSIPLLKPRTMQRFIASDSHNIWLLGSWGVAILKRFTMFAQLS